VVYVEIFGTRGYQPRLFDPPKTRLVAACPVTLHKFGDDEYAGIIAFRLTP
jgi:hypothetical protein